MEKGHDLKACVIHAHADGAAFKLAPGIGLVLCGEERGGGDSRFATTGGASCITAPTENGAYPEGIEASLPEIPPGIEREGPSAWTFSFRGFGAAVFKGVFYNTQISTMVD